MSQLMTFKTWKINKNDRYYGFFNLFFEGVGKDTFVHWVFINFLFVFDCFFFGGGGIGGGNDILEVIKLERSCEPRNRLPYTFIFLLSQLQALYRW